MMKLLDVYGMNKGGFSIAIDTLYALLKTRKAYQNISHKVLPSYEQHVKFVCSMPYDAWYLIAANDTTIVGAIYLTERSEIGLHLFERYQGQGYARAALAELKRRHGGTLYANIAPGNKRSQAFFEKHGFKQIAMTYKLDDEAIRPEQPFFDTAELDDPMNKRQQA